MEKECKEKYEGYKLTVKRWEDEFKKENHRIPSKVSGNIFDYFRKFIFSSFGIKRNLTQYSWIFQYDIKDASINVKQAYKMYYRMKTAFLSQTLTDVLEDDEDSLDSMNWSQNGSSFNVSSAISELLDPSKTLPEIREETKATEPCKLACKDVPTNPREFEAADEVATNENAWNDNLNKRKPKQKIMEQEAPSLTRKMSLKIEPSMMKPLRNPKKSLSKLKLSSNSLNSVGDDANKEVLPDLETILLEKSRSSSVIETRKSVSRSDIKTSIDIGWLDRHTSLLDTQALSKTSSSLSATSSFGLSNLHMNSFSSLSSVTCSSTMAEEKFHRADASDYDEVGNSDDEIEAARPILHVAKKRRLSSEFRVSSASVKSPPKNVPEVNVQKLPIKLPEKPKRLRKLNANKIMETLEEEVNDEAPADALGEKELEKSPPVMKRKRSVIKRSKDGISKMTKKATRILTRNKTSVKDIEDDEPQQTEEEEINFLIDSNLNEMTTVPRASEKELKTTEKLFDNYLKHDGTITARPSVKFVDAKTAAKKDALEKKIASGTLNENYVRVNLKKKIFVRGKKAFSFSKYKKAAWKTKKAAALAGPEMDMRGCDGGVLKCFNCGGVGHFAQQCKQKGDNLLPIDADFKEESLFPTLEEAAQMAKDQKLLVHSSKPDMLPVSSNEIWRQLNESSDEEVEGVGADKENKDGNAERKESAPEPQKVNETVKLLNFVTQFALNR